MRHPMANGGPSDSDIDIPLPRGFQTIVEFETARVGQLADLMEHFAAQGRPYATPEALMADMLDDVIDVWWDDHLKHGGLEDPCVEDDGVDALWRSEVEGRAQMEQGTEA